MSPLFLFLSFWGVVFALALTRYTPAWTIRGAAEVVRGIRNQDGNQFGAGITTASLSSIALSVLWSAVLNLIIERPQSPLPWACIGTMAALTLWGVVDGARRAKHPLFGKA